MSKVTQRSAVFSAICAVMEKHGISYTKATDYGQLLHGRKDIKSEVNDMLCAGFEAGEIDLSEPFETPAKLKSYTSGLISNWLRKDPELNGGTKYVPVNPGSRVGSTDPQMKALKILLQQTVDEADREEIQGFIDIRATELNAGKTKHKEVDFSVLPDALKAKFSKN